MGLMSQLDRVAGSFSQGLQGGMQVGAQVGGIRQRSDQMKRQASSTKNREDEVQKDNIRAQAGRGDQGALAAAQRYDPAFVAEIQALLEGRLKPDVAAMDAATAGAMQGPNQGQLAGPQPGAVGEAAKQEAGNLRAGAAALGAKSGVTAPRPADLHTPAVKSPGAVRTDMSRRDSHMAQQRGVVDTAPTMGAPAQTRAMSSPERSMAQAGAVATGLEQRAVRADEVTMALNNIDPLGPASKRSEALEKYEEALISGGLDAGTAAANVVRLRRKYKHAASERFMQTVSRMEDPKLIRGLIMEAGQDLSDTARAFGEGKAIQGELKLADADERDAWLEFQRLEGMGQSFAASGDAKRSAEMYIAAADVIEPYAPNVAEGYRTNSAEFALGPKYADFEDELRAMDYMAPEKKWQLAYNLGVVAALPNDETLYDGLPVAVSNELERALKVRRGLAKDEEDTAIDAEVVNETVTRFILNWNSLIGVAPDEAQASVEELNDQLNIKSPRLRAAFIAEATKLGMVLEGTDLVFPPDPRTPRARTGRFLGGLAEGTADAVDEMTGGIGIRPIGMAQAAVNAAETIVDKPRRLLRGVLEPKKRALQNLVKRQYEGPTQIGNGLFEPPDIEGEIIKRRREAMRRFGVQQ